MINLENLRQIQKSAGVLNNAPAEWGVFDQDVPNELIEQWKQFIAAKNQFNEVLIKYGIQKV